MWKRRSPEDDHFSLDRVAGRMFDDYRRAVAGGAPGVELAQILTGIAGCELAMSRTIPAMGGDEQPDVDGCTVGESARRAGLLMLEVASAAAGGAGGGVKAELQDPAGRVERAWQGLASAYRAEGKPAHDGDDRGLVEPISVGAGLGELWHAVTDVIGGQAAEVLVPLAVAHSYDLFRCECATHSAPDRIAAGGDG